MRENPGGQQVNARKQLEQAAADAHHRGETWARFWQQHGPQFDKLPAADRQEAIETALQILVTGEAAGRIPVANSMFGWDEAETDVDQAPPALVSDTETRARIDWQQLNPSAMPTIDHEAIAPAGPRASRQGPERTTRCGR
jgi:hypothetical protein